MKITCPIDRGRLMKQKNDKIREPEIFDDIMIYSASEKDGSFSSYRLPIKKELFERYRWPQEKEIPGFFMMDERSIKFYRSGMNTDILKEKPEHEDEIKSFNKGTQEDVLEDINHWLITKFVAGYKGATIKCKTSLLAQKLKTKLKAESIGNPKEIKEKIIVNFPGPSTDFHSQTSNCLANLNQMFNITSEIFNKFPQSGRDEYIKDDFEAIEGKEREVDNAAWTIWRNVHLSILSGSYLTELKLEDPYKLAPYCAFAKFLERAGDHCNKTAMILEQIYQLYKIEVKSIEKMEKLNKIFTDLSEMFKKFPDTYKKASYYFTSKIKDEKASIKADAFRREYVKNNCNQLQDIFGGTNFSRIIDVVKDLEPTIQIRITFLLGQMSEIIKRLITYPYNILLCRDTEVIHTEDLRKEVPPIL
jgi:hypothetical protein